MDKVLFVIADYPVTLEMALYAAAALFAALLVALIIRQYRLRHEAALEAAAAAAEQLRANFTQQLADRDGRIRDLDRALTHERQRAEQLVGEEREKNTELRAELAAMRTRLDEQARQNEMNLKRFLEARQQMTDEFKLIAGEVLQTHSETFTKQNREQVDVLLKPLQEKITEFHQGLIKDRSAMSEQIRALAESNLQITTEAHNLTRALKGNSQTQGAWGEMILSTILEQSGLREGEQFFTQASHTSEEGQRVRTDVEVLMPNNDRLIIDSKVSLTAFEAFVNAEDETRDMHLRAHIASVRNHITTLGDKGYQRAAKSSMDYVMMFVPIESALAAAIQNDLKLVEFSMSRGVMLTSPTTLMTVLRTIRNIWDIERRHRNAEVIAERAGALYDKVAGFLSTMDRVGQNLDRARSTFDDARSQLSTGRGNVVRQIEMLRELGASTTKSIPADWDGGKDDGPLLRVVGERDDLELWKEPSAGE
ncbi:MAG TPA: DNA recombination protein RmuC [Devosia sp.]